MKPWLSPVLRCPQRSSETTRRTQSFLPLNSSWVMLRVNEVVLFTWSSLLWPARWSKTEKRWPRLWPIMSVQGFIIGYFEKAKSPNVVVNVVECLESHFQYKRGVNPTDYYNTILFFHLFTFFLVLMRLVFYYWKKQKLICGISYV